MSLSMLRSATRSCAAVGSALRGGAVGEFFSEHRARCPRPSPIFPWSGRSQASPVKSLRKSPHPTQLPERYCDAAIQATASAMWSASRGLATARLPGPSARLKKEVWWLGLHGSGGLWGSCSAGRSPRLPCGQSRWIPAGVNSQLTGHTRPVTKHSADTHKDTEMAMIRACADTGGRSAPLLPPLLVLPSCLPLLLPAGLSSLPLLLLAD